MRTFRSLSPLVLVALAACGGSDSDTSTQDTGNDTAPDTDAGFDVIPFEDVPGDVPSDTPSPDGGPDVPDAPTDVPDPGDVVPDVADAADGSGNDAGDTAPDGSATPGALLVTEFMLSPCGTTTAFGQWIELYNASTQPIPLTGLRIADGTGGSWTLEGRVGVAAGDWFVIGFNDNLAENGGVFVDAVATGLAFPTDAGTITVGYPGLPDISLSYDLGETAPACRAWSLSADVVSPTAALDFANFCGATNAYGGANFGTPGEANPVCTTPDTDVDWCRLQSPTTATLARGATTLVYGRVFEAGITDRTTLTDDDAALRVELGVGPDGAAPDDAAWSWTPAVPNTGWTDGAEPGNDEYQATLTAPATLGSYDFAYRASRDGGTTWVYCDRAAGPGADGAENGYQTSNAGALTVPDPCLPNPCTTPPAGTCLDGIATSYAPTGFCSLTETATECVYTVSETVCGPDDTCEAGVCIPPERWDIDFCRLQSPATLGLLEGEEGQVFGRLYIEGLTDRTFNNNLSDVVLAEVGFGPRGVDPADGQWTWTAATPTPGFDGRTFAEPNNDEYTGTIVGPAFNPEAAFEYAFRFSGDAGDTWTYCDRNVGPGSDGSQDGYQSANAGALTSLPPLGPCNPNPCTTPPDGVCEGSVAITYAAPGVCEVVSEGSGIGVGICTWPVATSQDCSARGASCEVVEGAPTCVGGAPRPTAGQVVFTEVLVEATAPAVQYVELLNLTTSELLLDGCTLGWAGGTHDIAGDLVLAQSGRLVIAAAAGSTAVPAADYLAPELSTLPASGQLQLTCGGATIDVARYREAQLTPNLALQLSDDSSDPTLNDYYARWCTTPIEGSAAFSGTPGQPNVVCPDASYTVNWCRLQFPATINASPLDAPLVYGRVYIEGLTDVSTAVNEDPAVVVEAGWGPDGSQPATSTAWVWSAASPTPGFNGATAGEAPNDEYVAGLALSSEGTFDYAFRVSGNGGETWTYCDRNAGFGQDGAENGYQPANAGNLVAQLGLDECFTDTDCTGEGFEPFCDGSQAVEAIDTALCFENTCEYAFITQTCEGATPECRAGACEPLETWTIGYCKLQFPNSLSLAPGASQSVFGIVFASGLTTRSNGVDSHPSLIAEVGYGPASGVPPTGFTWFQAAPNAFWNAAVAGQPNNDEYVGDLEAPAPGIYSYAYRFSGDGGETWTYCDTGAGTADGFQPSAMGTLTVSP